ncbi:ATP-binding protein [Vibrio splendidus]|uniref:ATP-binding protein n=1 Tax=Vibrio splendidus TaxID=29497 RepID=UPI00148DE3FD|nr:transporter substrate-binding domain-containing protein [Vibrio splendidus]
MKIYISCFFVFLSLSFACAASEMMLTPSQTDYLHTKKTIVIAKPTHLFNHAWEEVFVSQNKGNSTEVINLLEQKLNVNIEIKEYFSSRALLDAIVKGEVDFTLGYAETRERTEQFIFSNTLYNVPNVFWFRDKTAQTSSKKDLRWACIRHSLFCQIIRDLGFTKILMVNSTSELFTALAVGTADVTVIDLTSVQSYYSVVTPGEWQGTLSFSKDLPPFPVQVLMSKEAVQLKTIIDTLLEHKLKDINQISSNYFYHFYDDIVNQVIKSQYGDRTIRYTVCENIYPYSYFDPTTQKTTGFIHDAFTLISRKLGVNFEYVPPKDKDVIEMLRNREVDFLPSFAVGNQSNNEFISSDPFMTLQWAYIATNQNVKKKKTAILDRTGYFIQKKSLGLDFNEAVIYQDIEDLVKDMSNGKITHAYIPQSIANLYVYNGYTDIFHIVAQESKAALRRDIGVILHQDSTFLQNVINSAISMTTQNEIDHLNLKHHNITAQYGYSEERIVLYTLASSSFIFVLIAYGLIKTRRLSISLSKAKQSEQQSYEQIQWLMTLLDSLPNLISIHDQKNKLVLSNSAFNKQRNLCLLADERPESCWLKQAEIQDKNTITLGVWTKIKCHCSGQEKHFRVIRQHIMDRSDGSCYTITVLDDLTRSEAQQRELEISHTKAQEAIKARDLFLAIVSHELRTPIAAMIGLMELLSTKIECKDNMELLSNAQVSAERLKLLVSDILDISKMEANQLHLESKFSNIYQELCPIFRTFETHARLNNLNFKLDWKIGTIYSASLDWLRVTQILNNLLNNAIKFTESGFILINVIVAERQLHLSITDTGCGMSKQQIIRAFQPFAQGDHSISRRYGGTGLGITVVQRLVTMMNGELKIESKQGLGTKISVIIPIEAKSEIIIPYDEIYTEDREILKWLEAWEVPHQNYNEQNTMNIVRSNQWQNLYPDHLLSTITTPSGSLTLDTKNRYQFEGNVLVADDDPINRLLFAKQLNQFGLNTFIVKDGQEALDILKLKIQVVDLVITDCHMPNMDGYELTKIIKSSPELSHCPVIGCTAEDSKLVVEKAERVGMNLVIYKPYSFNELALALKQSLPATSIKQQPNQPWAEDYSEDEQNQMATVILESFTADKSMLQGEKENVKEVSHRIKGSAGLLGLTALYRAAKDCEKDPNNAKKLTILIDELTRSIESTSLVLKRPNL